MSLVKKRCRCLLKVQIGSSNHRQLCHQAVSTAAEGTFQDVAAYSMADLIGRQAVDASDRAELQTLQERLDNKIRIISPAIDMIELMYGPHLLLLPS